MAYPDDQDIFSPVTNISAQMNRPQIGSTVPPAAPQAPIPAPNFNPSGSAMEQAALGQPAAPDLPTGYAFGQAVGNTADALRSAGGAISQFAAENRAGFARPFQNFYAGATGAPPITVSTSPAPRVGIPGNEPSGPLSGYGGSGEGGLGMAGRGYPTGSVERAANASPVISGEGGLGMEGRGYAAPPLSGVVGTASGFGRTQQYTQADLNALGAGGDPAAAAEMKARYGAMIASQKMDEQQGLARRDASIREQIARADAYRGGINAFEEAGRQRVARINARGNEIFGPNFGGVRAAQSAAAAERAGTAARHTGAEARDFFKEAATTEELAGKARAGVSAERKAAVAEKTAGVDLQGKQLDLSTKQRLDTLGQKIASGQSTEKDHANFLTLTGHDKPDEYTVSHIAGGTTLAPDGVTPIKLPDRLFAVHKRTGKAEELTGVGKQGAAAPPPPREQWLKTAVADNPGKSLDELRKHYDKTYGGGG